MDVKKINTTALAYIGDAVYEVYVRQHVMEYNQTNVDMLHKRAIAFVRAEGQASVIKHLVKQRDVIEAPDNGAFRLSDEEAALVRRARNHKSASKPKNADPVIYKWATAFEALVGYLHLLGENERAELLIHTAIDFIENERRQVMSKADVLFVKMCQDIIDNGFSSEGQIVRPRWEDGTPAHTIKRFGVVNRYDLQEEFPALTLRPTGIKSAVDELLWIWQKKSNNIKDLSTHIWDQWADEDGSIGKAYGYQLGVKYRFHQGEMDQVDNVLWQLKNTPYSRRIMTNIFNFNDLLEMGLEPCAYSMTFNVTGNKLNGILNQRSQDILAANNWNVVQYAVLIHMFAQVSGLVPGELVHVIADAHIYDRHVDIIKELIQRPQYPAPKFRLNPEIKNFYDFTTDDIEITDYQKNPQIKGIPVAV